MVVLAAAEGSSQAEPPVADLEAAVVLSEEEPLEVAVPQRPWPQQDVQVREFWMLHE